MKTLEERFWSKVQKSDGCWLWTASTTTFGYGQILVGRIDGKLRHGLAHRLSLEFATGRPIPKGLCVLHSCDTPACVNPAHLRLGSKKDNMQDALSRGRFKPPLRHGATATEEINRRRQAGESLRAIGRSMGLSHQTVSYISNRFGEWKPEGRIKRNVVHKD